MGVPTSPGLGMNGSSGSSTSATWPASGRASLGVALRHARRHARRHGGSQYVSTHESTLALRHVDLKPVDFAKCVLHVDQPGAHGAPPAPGIGADFSTFFLLHLSYKCFISFNFSNFASHYCISVIF